MVRHAGNADVEKNFQFGRCPKPKLVAIHVSVLLQDAYRKTFGLDVVPNPAVLHPKRGEKPTLAGVVQVEEVRFRS